MRRPFFTSQRWPLLVAFARPDRRIGLRVAALVTSLTGGVVAFVPEVPLALRVVLSIASLASVAWAIVGQKREARATGAYVEADATTMRRVTPEGATDIVAWNDPFGVMILASYGRPTALLAFTRPDQTRYVPARLENRTEDDDALFARVAVLADLDLVDGVTHDPALSSAAAAEILRTVEERQRAALGRVYLSDGRGLPIALDPATLTVGERSFDLASDLAWRPLMFHESTGQGAALYQATWIHQGSAEVVLVAPMPSSIVPRDANAREATGKLGRALTRDLKLLQAPAEVPPPREVRVAIDRPFMLAVRRALAEAPRATKVATSTAPKATNERRV